MHAVFNISSPDSLAKMGRVDRSEIFLYFSFLILSGTWIQQARLHNPASMMSITSKRPCQHENSAMFLTESRVLLVFASGFRAWRIACDSSGQGILTRKLGSCRANTPVYNARNNGRDP